MLTKRKLGRQGLEVAELGLGCMGMSQSYGTRNDPESIATIHRALELGVSFFDTAEVYGPFHNEQLLGQALQGKRDQTGHRNQVRLQDPGRKGRRLGQPARAHP